jgi:hypothetical protein
VNNTPVARDLGSTARAAETISVALIRSEWASGKPHKKSAPETPKRGHLAIMVFTGGKLKFSAHIPQAKLNPEDRSKQSCNQRCEGSAWLRASTAKSHIPI